MGGEAEVGALYDDLRAWGLQIRRFEADSWAERLKLVPFGDEPRARACKLVPFEADPCATITWFYKLVERNE